MEEGERRGWDREMEEEREKENRIGCSFTLLIHVGEESTFLLQ